LRKVNNAPIGVFDSGIGGLTVLDNLIDTFPGEKFIYVADTKRCPYGEKTSRELEQIVAGVIKYFESLEVKMIVIACNTATANSYKIKSNIPIIRIIEPTAKRALEVYKNKIAVLATDNTILSGSYNKYLGDKMIGVKASPFVRIIEAGSEMQSDSQQIIRDILNPIIGKVDTVILGCTHFGLIEPIIKDIMGNVQIVDSSKSLANDVKLNLETLGFSSEPSYIDFRCTGDISELKISWFKKKMDVKRHIDIKIDYERN